MNLNDIIVFYVNNKDKGTHKKKVGRYWSSSLYGIITGRLKPEDYFKEEIFDLTACRNIDEGVLRENALKERLDFAKVDYKYQPKKVMKFKNFEIVATSDFGLPEMLMETKCPRIMPNKIKEYHYPQLEAQYRAFNKPVYIAYLKERWQYKMFQYHPSEKLWKHILKKVKKFHEELIKITKNKNS